MEDQVNSFSGKTIHTAVIIGGVNADIWGAPAGGLILKDSNPGTISVKPGGVGRNIAHNLRLLGLKVSMITAIGGDIYAGLIESSCAGLGIDTTHSLRLADQRSSVYLYITDAAGDMHVGISDMDIVNAITPEFLAQEMDFINSFDCAVIDANLSEASIRFLAENCTIPLYADPVSTVKGAKMKPVLGKLAAFKPNMLEASILTGETAPEKAAAFYLNEGMKRVFISLGANGILACDREHATLVPAIPTAVVNATGAGDSATAAIIYGGVCGLSLESTAKLAVCCGALTCACEETNCPNLKDALSILG